MIDESQKFMIFQIQVIVLRGVEIKGGVCYFLWEEQYDGDCKVVTHENGKQSEPMIRPLKEDSLDIFIRYNKR